MSREINILPLFKLVGEHLLIPFDYAQPLLSHLALGQGFTLSQRMVTTLLLSVLRYSLNVSDPGLIVVPVLIFLDS